MRSQEDKGDRVRWPTVANMVDRGGFGPCEVAEKAEMSHTPWTSLAEPKETQGLGIHTPLAGWFQSHSA